MLARLAPDEPEAHGLVALMELHASRAGTRVAASGEPILLMDQHRAGWDQILIPGARVWRVEWPQRARRARHEDLQATGSGALKYR
jgi:predicted RNA polymerase sigma factor